jgi:hypothetical protein
MKTVRRKETMLPMYEDKSIFPCNSLCNKVVGKSVKKGGLYTL